MHDDKPPSPRSPFMMSPSARPPSADEARVVVRVPPPPGAPSPQDFAGTPMYGSAPPQAFQSGQYPSGYPQGYPPNAPMQQQPGFDQQFAHAPTMMAGQQPYAMGALPPMEEKKKGISPIPIVAVILSSLVLAGVFLFGNKEQPAPASPQAAQSAAPPPTASIAITPPPPVVTAPHVLGSTSAAASAPAAFDPAAAKAALEALSADLATCKLPKGKTCKLKVTFSPDGNVKKSEALAPCAGSPPAKCLANGVKKATIAPFIGNDAHSITYAYPHGK